MSDFAQKRDVSDPATVAAFAKLVEKPERLRLLLVLTVADIRAVGPGVWNGWKGQLMRELYAATEAVFRGGRGVGPGRQLPRPAGAAPPRPPASCWSRPIRRPKAWARAMEDAYFTAFSHRAQMAHAELARRAAEEGGAAAKARPSVDRNAAGADGRRRRPARPVRRPGRGARRRSARNVVGARAFTSSAGRALDVFYVQDAAGAPFGRDNPRRRPARRPPPGRGRAASRRRRTPPQRRPAAAPPRLDRDPARAVIDNEASAVGHRGRGLRPRPAGPAGRDRPHPGRAGAVDPVGARRQLRRAGRRRLLRPGRGGAEDHRSRTALTPSARRSIVAAAGPALAAGLACA